MLAGILTAVKVIAAIGAAVVAGFAAWKGFSSRAIGTGSIGKPMLSYDDPYYDPSYGSVETTDRTIDDYVRRISALKAKRQQETDAMIQKAQIEQQKKIQERQKLDSDLATIQAMINQLVQQKMAERNAMSVQTNPVVPTQTLPPAPAPMLPAAPVIPTPTVGSMMNQPQVNGFRDTVAGVDLAWDETEKTAIANYLNPQNQPKFVPFATPSIPSLNVPVANQNNNNTMMVYIDRNTPAPVPRQPVMPMQSLYGLPLNQPTPNPWMGYNPSMALNALNSHYTYHPMMRRNQFYNSPDNGYWQDMRQFIVTDQQPQQLFKPLPTPTLPARIEQPPVIDVKFEPVISEPVNSLKGEEPPARVERVGNF